MKKIVLVFAVFLMTVACFAESGKIYSSIDSATLLGIMKQQGYSAELNNNADIIWRKDGVVSHILFSNGRKNESNFYFFCCYSYDADKSAKALDLCNEYNKKNKFGKSYVFNGAVCYCLSINLRGGVTEERIIDYLDDCMVFSKQWKKLVVEKL